MRAGNRLRLFLQLQIFHPARNAGREPASPCPPSANGFIFRVQILPAMTMPEDQGPDTCRQDGGQCRRRRAGAAQQQNANQNILNLLGHGGNTGLMQGGNLQSMLSPAALAAGAIAVRIAAHEPERRERALAQVWLRTLPLLRHLVRQGRWDSVLPSTNLSHHSHGKMYLKVWVM